MSDKHPRILLVEDEQSHIELIRRALKDSPEDYVIETACSVAEAKTKQNRSMFDLILVDYRLPDGNGFDLLPGANMSPDIPIVVMTSFGDESVAVQAMKMGALDYVVKSDASFMAMPNVIRRALREWKHIVNHRIAEKRLRESETQLRAFIESAEDLVYFIELDGSIHVLNSAYEKTTGYSTQDFNDDPQLWRKIIHPDDLKKAEEFIAQRPAIHEMEYRLRTKSGQWHWMQSLKVGVTDDAGNYIGYNCIDRDITKKKEIEERSAEINVCLLSLGANAKENIEKLTTLCCNVLEGTFAIYGQPRQSSLCIWGKKNILDEFCPEGCDEESLCLDIFKKKSSTPVVIPHLQQSKYADTNIAIKKYGLQTFIGMCVWLDNDCVGIVGIAFDYDKTLSEADLNYLNIVSMAISVEEKRQQVLEEVCRSERRLALALESAGLGLWDHNLATGEIYRSKEWAEMLGYSAEDIDARVESWINLIHPEDKGKSTEAAKKYEAGLSSSYNIEHRMLAKSGEYRWILNWGKIVERDERGNPLRAIGTHMDITERKKAEEALRESEQKYRAIVDNIGAGIVMIDKDMRVLSLNKQMAKWFPDVDVKDTPLCFTLLLCQSESKRCKNCPAIRTLENGRVNESIIGCRINDKERKFRVTNSPIKKKSGEIIALISVVEDITNKLKLEEELSKAEKLESIGVLAGGIAHDFNNILTAILGNISLARIELQEGEDVSGILKDVEIATVRAKDLTQQLLTFSKGGTPVRKTVSIGTLIKESAIFALRGSNVKLEYSADPNLYSVDIDEGQINQVINNLVINADQAMPQGGEISIDCFNQTIDAAADFPVKPGKYVRIIIRDKGMGIPKEHLKKIFDPFFTTKQSGSGLGLATTYSIIRSHFGHIRVFSEIGKGSEFQILLPASSNKIKNGTDHVEKVPKGEGRILVVDDEESVRKLVEMALKRIGYEILTAADGKEAISLYAQALRSQNPIDIVLMDLTIPGGMGGEEAIYELRKIDPKAKVIVSSGYSNDPIMSDYRTYGFAACVAKPYKVTELAETIHDVLRVGNLSIN